MKTFKLKDLVISMEGQPRINQFTLRDVTRNVYHCFQHGCSLLVSQDCRYNHSNVFDGCIMGSLVRETIYTPTCGGTKCRGSWDPTYFQLGDIEYLEDLKSAKQYIEEYERALNESLKPGSIEELEMLESKLNAAISEVKELKKKM